MRRRDISDNDRDPSQPRYIFCQSCRQRILLNDANVDLAQRLLKGPKSLTSPDLPSITARAHTDPTEELRSASAVPQERSSSSVGRSRHHHRHYEHKLPVDSYIFLNDDFGSQVVADAAQRSHTQPSLKPSHHHSHHTSRARTEDSPIQNGRLRQSSSGSAGSGLWNANSSSEESEWMTLDMRMQRITEFLQTLSANSTIDHPLCEDCCDLVLKELGSQLSSTSKERAKFAEALRKLDLSPFSQRESKKASQETQELQDREQRMLQQVRVLETERIRLLVERDKLDQEESELEALEAQFCKESNEFECEYEAFVEEQQSIQLQCAQAETQLAVLSATNILQDMFQITLPPSEPYGMINTFRIGRTVAKPPIEWNELNAGLGQICLLLDTLAKHQNFSFGNFKLCPMGSFSRIEKEGPQPGYLVSYDLFVSGELNLGSLWWNRRFNHGMMGLLACLKMLGDHVEAQDSKFQMPFRIHKEKIGETSIRLQFNQDEAWTRAMRHFLTNMHWLMVWHSGRKSNRRYP